MSNRRQVNAISRPDHVSYGMRLLLAFGALIPTLLAMILFFMVRDYIENPQDFHWGNAGEEQMVGVTAIYGGIGALLTYVVFIMPMVLLWPVRSQIKHWHAVLLVSLMWLPLSLAIVGNARPIDMWQQLRHPFHPDLVWLLEPFALLASGLYLFLLRRMGLRITDGDLAQCDDGVK